MFSELIKREVTKLILAVFLYTNLSPAFCMQGMPEYVINVEHRQIGNKERAEMQTAFAVKAMQLVQESATVVYKTITEQLIYPFMTAAIVTLEAGARLREILQNVKASISETEPTSKSCETETQISRGFCLNIPELGDLLISHDGDIILDAREQLKKSVRIVAPKQVILNGIVAKNIEVESTAAILIGKTTTKIDSLKFKAIRNSEDLENALFIDEGAILEIGVLSLEEALLLNTGRLRVTQGMDLQQGMFLNTGIFETTADPVALKNIAYFYNGSEAVITADGNIILNAGRTVNLGKMTAREINLISSELFHNKGEILTTAFFNINGLGELINEGTINGNSGTVDIRGKRFEQRQGRLLGSKVDFNTEESVLYGEVKGSEGFFQGEIQNGGTLHFQRGVLSGNFVNSGEVNFERLLELIGTKVIIRNSMELKAGKIESGAIEGVIISETNGKVLTESISSKKHLQLEANMPILKTLKTEKGAKLLITKEAKTPKLQKIENHGDSTFILGNTELSILQNTVEGILRLESSSPFEHLDTLDQVQGTAVLKGIFSKLVKLSILSGTKFTLLPGSCFTQVTDLYIQSRGQIEFHTDAFKILRGITNSGALIIRGTQESEKTELIAPAQQGLVIGGIYKGEIGAILQLENGAKVSADNWDNRGKILSRNGLKITQTGGSVTKWGDMESGGNIDYEITGIDIGLDNGFINPKTKGTLRIVSNRNVTIPSSFESASDLEIQSENLTVPGKLKTKKLKVKTKKFTLTGYIGTRESAEVICDEFTNTSGRFESLGDMTFNVAGAFTNTGGMKKEQSQIPLTYYTQSPSVANKTFGYWAARQTYKNYPGTTIKGVLSRVKLNPIKTSATVSRELRDILKIGQIGSLGTFTINSREWNNSFGLLFGGNILSQTRINNVNGIIYSRNGIQIKGSLQNGFTQALFSVQNAAVDPNKPIIKVENLPVGANWQEHSHYFHGSTYTFSSYQLKPSQVIVGYTPYAGGKVPIHTQKYPGYIFAEGDIRIDSTFDTTLGTIVSAQNIYIGGRAQTGTANLVAHGNIEMAMKQADLNQIKARAENIVIEQLQSLVIGGYITPVVVSDGQKGVVINLEKLAKPLGFALSERPMLTDASSLGMPLSIVPAQRGFDKDVVLRNPGNMGLISPAIDAVPFISTVSDLVTAKLLRLIVTPLYGTEIGFNVNLTGILERNGKELMQSFVYSKDCDIPDGALALVYGEEKEGDAIRDGAIQRIQQRTPYLFVGNIINEAIHYLKARQEAILRSREGSVTIRPEDFNIDSKDLTIEADQNIELLSDYIYSDSRKIGVNPVKIEVPGSLEITARGDVVNRASQIRAGDNIVIQSKQGSITEESMEIDPVSKRVSGLSVVSQSSVAVPEMEAGGVIREIAQRGTLSQMGSAMKAGKGIEFEAERHIVKPTYVTTQVTTHSGNTTSTIRMRTPKESVFETPEILFNSNDTTLIGAQIVSSRVINSGNLYATSAEGTKESHATTVSRRRCFGIRIGKSTQTVHSVESFYEPTRIIGEYFESSGTGKCTLEGAVVDVLEMAIKKKDLIDRTFYTKRTTHITRSSRGFFAPRIKGDPFYESSKALGKVVTFGDVVPSTLNVVGAGAQTLTHAMMLANLSKVSNPLGTISQIFMSRFVSGFGYSNITQRTRITETIPHQTQAKVGILKVSNDRTHLEGIWDVDQAEIETKLFTTSAPKYEATQTTETEGFSVSLSPAALLSAAIAPGIASNLACLPSVSVSESEEHIERTAYLPMKFNANRLFVQCDNAVFSGSQIRAKVIEMIVMGDLTIESLRDSFKSESNSDTINESLAALFSSVHKVDNRAILDPKLGAVPTLRIADEEEITEKVNTLAELIGEEKFYLKVGGLLYQKGSEIGLKPDGLVTKTESEKIEAEKILKANIPETHIHKRHVINPTVGELVACMGQIDEFKQVRAQFITERLAEGATMEEAAEEGKKLQELLETPEVKESYREIKAANEKLIKAAEKIEKIDQETRERAAEMSQPQMEEFLKTSFQSIERQNAVQEYNTIAKGCLIQATKMRLGIQNWAKEHPTYAKVAEMAMNAVRYSVMITSTIALVSSFVSTAPISIPVAVTGVGLTIAKTEGIKFLKEKAIEYAREQAYSQVEKAEFEETARWLIENIENAISIKNLNKLAKDPMKELTPKFMKTYTSCDKYGEIAVILNRSVNAYCRSQKERLMGEILDKIV